MQKLLLTALLLGLSTWLYGQTMNYTVNLNDIKDDRFKVSLEVSGLKKKNMTFQFAATAPGTYQTMNIGRYVEDFTVFDAKGKKLKAEKKGINQWIIDKPQKVAKIEYKIAETWDVKPHGPGHTIYKMCGTSLEEDHVLINGQGVFGYFHGLQGSSFRIKLEHPQAWQVGTALTKASGNTYTAKSFDHLVDSPILLGRLTQATTQVAGANVEIFTYSKTDKIKSEQLLKSMSGMLEAAGTFLKKLPVNRYVFLYHFEDEDWGAWEHSYSSTYVNKEREFTPEYGQRLTSTAAHEFFHIVTPLNIHSEIIEKFNFVTPTPSRHLWLYEGVTEWASDMMQLRGNLFSTEVYFSEMGKKIDFDKHFDKNYSLLKLSMTSFSDRGQREYSNIYARGAIVAALLDIRLLELSEGKRGLREVVLELSKKYGTNKAFDDETFFDTFVKMTYPEIADFFGKYIKNANPLPIADYYSKLGIKYTPEINTGKVIPSLGFEVNFLNGEFVIVSLDEEHKMVGLKEGDVIVGVDRDEVNGETVRKVFKKLKAMDKGETYRLKVRRGESPKTFNAKILSTKEILTNVFEIQEDASEAQKALFEAWKKNM